MINLNKDWILKKINELKLRPSRGNGQNFLISLDPITAIIAAGAVAAGDRVLEIGPGFGVLTEELLHAGAHVTAIEYDNKIAEYLKKTIPKKYPHEIIEGDVLQIARPEFLEALGAYKVIANIPYHITGDIIRLLVESTYPPTVMCLLIQKEVGERLTAGPPHMNQLALFTQWSADVEYIETISRKQFMPAPEVDSAIIRITPRKDVCATHGVTKSEQQKLFSFIKRGFAHPRKQLANNLGVQKNDVNMSKLFDFSRRAESLSMDEWITLSRSLSE